jgi:kinetochore protein NDC80
MLNDVIKFKIHIQKSLEEYEVFVDEELNRELENLETGENNPEGEQGQDQEPGLVPVADEHAVEE